LGNVGGAKHRALQTLQPLVDLLVAVGAGHRLAQRHQAPFGASDAGTLNAGGSAALLQPRHPLQRRQQQKAQRDRHRQVTAQPLATLQHRISEPLLHGDLLLGQAQQGKGSPVDQTVRQAQLPERVEQLHGPERPHHQRGEQHEQHQRHLAQARG